MTSRISSDQPVTAGDLVSFGDDLSERIRKSVVDNLSDVMGQFAERIDERFDRLEEHFDRLERHFERLQNTLDHFLKRLDDTEKDNAARDAQIARLERWIETVAKQTGVKLEY